MAIGDSGGFGEGLFGEGGGASPSNISQGTGSASATSTATAVGQATARAVGTAAGTSAALAIGVSIITGGVGTSGWQTPTYFVKAELNGVGNGWTDITADLSDEPLILDYGIKGTKPDVRVATPGTFSFGLRNGSDNSGGTIGYYSAYNGVRRAGWAHNIRIQYGMTYAGVTMLWMGRLRTIDAEPDTFGNLVVHCVAYDWMLEASKQNMQVALQQNQRADQCFAALVATVPQQPSATQVDVSTDTFLYAFDNVYSSSDVLSAFGELARSEVGYIYCKRDMTNGQTPVFESRHTRPLVSSFRAILSGNIQALDVANSAEDILNHIRVTVNPRHTVASQIVAKVDGTDTAPLGGGQTVTMFLDFTDPVQRDSFVGATNVVVPLVPGTDFAYNSAADGAGSDLTGPLGSGAGVSIVATVFASSIKLVITNNGTAPAYRTLLQVRGDAVYAQNAITSEYRVGDADNLFEMNLEYQTDPLFGQDVTAYLANLYSQPAAYVRAVSFYANENQTSMLAALLGEISEKVALTEQVTGFNSDSKFYINSVRHEVDVAGNVLCTWGLVPADVQNYFILGVPGHSELGSMVLGL